MAEHNITKMLNDGLQAEMQKEWPKAISIYKEVLSKEPKRVDLWLRMVDIYGAENNVSGAEEALLHAIELKSDDATLYARLSSMYAADKASKKAYDAIAKAYELDPENRDYLSRYALLAEVNKDWDVAVNAYEKMLKEDPKRADLWKRIGDIEAVRKNIPGVIFALEKQIALEPENAALHYELARTYSMQEQTKKALEEIKQALKLDPDNQTYLRMEVDLAGWSGEKKSKLEAYEKLLKKNPNDTEVLLEKARTLESLGQYAESVRTYKRYLALKLKDLKVWLELAYVEKTHVSTAAAVKSLEKALRLNGLVHKGVKKRRKDVPNVDIPILEYHCVGKKYKDKYHIDPAEFDRQMHLLKQKGYTSLTLNDLYQALYGSLKLPAKPVIVTFDDGCKESYSTIYPILKKYHMKGEFYLITDLITETEAQREARVKKSAIRGEGKKTNGYLLWKEIQKMARGGMAFGSHTATHIDMQEANLNETAYQLLFSKIAIKAYSGINITDFSYPYGKGSFRKELHKLLNRYGYFTAVASDGGIENSTDLNMYNIRRIEIYGSDGIITPEPFFNRVSPSKAETYYERARWYYASKEEQKQAEKVISKAVALDQKNAKYLKLQADIESWIENYVLASEALEKLLDINPSDDILLNLSQSQSWANQLDDAAKSYRSYLERHPRSQKALLDYSNVQSWRGNYSDALTHFALYEDYFGKDLPCLEGKASALAWAQRPARAQEPIGGILSEDPNNYNALFAQTVAYWYAREPYKALERLEKVKTLRPDTNDTKLLEKFILTPLRSNVSADFRYYRDSDDIDIRSGYMKGEYVISPLTRVFGAAGVDRLYADTGSGYETIEGKTSIDHKSAWIGASHRFNKTYMLQGYIGVAETDDNSEFIYDATLFWQPSDTFKTKFSHNYGYYLISPKSVSLDIMKRTTRMDMEWYPSLEDQVKLSLDYSAFSDGNDRWGAIAEVIHQIDRRQYWNYDLGMSTILYGFSDDFDHGYYDPEWSQTYFLTGYAYWKISPEDGVSFSVSLGTTKDNQMDNFEFASSLNAEGTFGLYSDWMLVIRAGYDYNVQQRAGAYDGAVVGMSIMRRF